MNDNQQETWRTLVERAQLDMDYYSNIAVENRSAFGRTFQAVRMAECDAILAMDAMFKRLRQEIELMSTA